MDSKARTIDDLREHVGEKATTDEAFRARLIADPKAAIEEELGLTIPDGFSIKVHEDHVDTSHMVLPPATQLTPSDLEHAAGGAGQHAGDAPQTFWDDQPK